ncbi:MAG: type II toxin-antitoxin system VapC family toxin [Candidatus Thermoplasmatota archaeon]|nr:type II toxin-antitoxin system VapC family toxin [Candidatus Thermoplasmatota archaeon]
MLLDTSVLVEIDRGIDQKKMEHLISLSPHVVSSASVMEMSTGFFRSGRKAIKLDDFLSSLTIIPIDQKVARRGGKIAADLIEEGKRIEINDLYIAATALLNEETLVTKNVKHFERIDDLEVVDWTDI